MARRSIHLLALAALALSLTVAGCRQSDTVLLIEVWGDVNAIVPFQFYVNILTPTDVRGFPVPKDLDPASSHPLPQSFTISMDRSLAGPFTITVDAIDAVGTHFAAGMTTLEHPVIGGQTVVSVMLTLVPGVGGSDGGAAGVGGGSDAQDAADGMGLDDASD